MASVPFKDFDLKKPHFPIEAGLALEGQLKTKDGTPTSGDVTL